MEIKLLDDRYRKFSLNHMSVKDLESIYSYYKKGYDNLEKLLDDNISLDDFWYIVSKYYDIELFQDEHSTLSDCKLLGINTKRLNTNFILYKKDNHAPKFYFEDWIVMEQNAGFDGRRIYNERQIDDLIDSERIVPLYTYATRPESKRLEHVLNDDGGYDLYYNGRYVTDESYLESTDGELESVTNYSDWLDIEFNIYNHPVIQQRMREKVFTKNRIIKDMDYYRFRALEYLKLLRNKVLLNDRFKDALESERDSLIKKL